MEGKFLVFNNDIGKYMGLTENGEPFWTGKENASILHISNKTTHQDAKSLIAEIWQSVDVDLLDLSIIKFEKKED